MEILTISLYIISIVVTLGITVASTLWLFPHLIITAFVKITIATSQFSKKCITFNKKEWCTYLERGSVESTAKSILFIHGFSGSAVDFAKAGRFFDKTHHLVSIDLSNHGDSSALYENITLDYMVKFVKMFCERSKLHRRKFHIVGFSLGGAISATYASTYPEDVASVTLLDSAGFEPLVDFDERNAVQFDDKTLAKQLDFLSSGQLSLPKLTITALKYYKNRKTEKMLPVVQGILKNMKVDEKMFQQLKQLPIFVLWGELDKVFPVSGATKVQEKLPHAKVNILPDCSHVLLLTHMKKVMEQISTWLGELDDSTENIVPRNSTYKVLNSNFRD